LKDLPLWVRAFPGNPLYACFYSLAEARIIIESWRRHYNTERPHGSLGYKTPAPEVSSPPSPRGRLRNPDQRRRPR
jgi:transposase InsO family protein